LWEFEGGRRLSAIGTKQTSMPTLSMSALGGEADMAHPYFSVR